MTSTASTLGAYDGLEKAEPGEPWFIVLARDASGPATLTEWCRLRRNAAIKLYGDSKDPRDIALLAAELAQCANAERIAEEMAEWRAGNVAAIGQRSTYSEIERTAEELAEADRRTRRDAAVRHFREAAYHLSEGRNILVDQGALGEMTKIGLIRMLAEINGLADEFTPTRPGAEAQLVLPEPETAGAPE